MLFLTQLYQISSVPTNYCSTLVKEDLTKRQMSREKLVEVALKKRASAASMKSSEEDHVRLAGSVGFQPVPAGRYIEACLDAFHDGSVAVQCSCISGTLSLHIFRSYSV